MMGGFDNGGNFNGYGFDPLMLAMLYGETGEMGADEFYNIYTDLYGFDGLKDEGRDKRLD